MAIFSASISILCIVFYLGIMAYLHIANKHIYSPIHHAVSDYGVGQSRKYFLLAGYSGIIRNIFIAIALVAWKYVFTFKSIAIIMLIFTLVGFIGVAVFPTDIEGAPKTAQRRLHLLFAVLQFTALAILILNMTDYLKPVSMGFFVVLKAIEYFVRIGLSTLILGMVLPVMKKYFGLFERIFLYSGNIYFLVFCILIISTQLR